MALTKTINYTQNVPVSLGFSNELTPAPSRDVKVTINFVSSLADAKMGRIIFPPTTGVKIEEYGYDPEGATPALFTISGEVSAVNTCLNGAQFVNHFYKCEEIDQNFLSQNRTLPTDGYGELVIQVPAGTSHGLSVGSFCRISSVTGSTGPGGWYLVTKVDDVTSPKRLWLSFRGVYQINDLYFSGDRKNVAVGDYLQNTSSVNICPITDVAYMNPQGTFNTTIIVNDATLGDSNGVITFVGSPFIAEPTFTSDPPTTVATGSAGAGNWYSLTTMGQIAQADNNYQSVQVALKYLENDPMYLGVSSYTSLPGYPSGGSESAKLAFIGAAINTKAQKDTPAYVNDASMGIFGVNQIGSRVSQTETTGIIRWHFYGTPDECNLALQKMTYYRPPGVTKDIGLETRIVNGRTRIYRNRGK